MEDELAAGGDDLGRLLEIANPMLRSARLVTVSTGCR
jgi:hypothetical protein